MRLMFLSKKSVKNRKYSRKECSVIFPKVIIIVDAMRYSVFKIICRSVVLKIAQKF